MNSLFVGDAYVDGLIGAVLDEAVQYLLHHLRPVPWMQTAHPAENAAGRVAHPHHDVCDEKTGAKVSERTMNAPLFTTVMRADELHATLNHGKPPLLNGSKIPQNT